MKMLKTIIALSAALLVAGHVQAEKYSLSGWLAPTHVMTREIHVAWADGVRKASNGKIDFEVFMGGALLPPLSTIQGVRDGVAQAGHVAAPYHPSEFPIANLAGDMGHRIPDPFVLAFAYLDFSMNDPAAYKEWRDNGGIPAATVSTPAYYYLCRGVVRTAEDLKGKRVRAPGGGWARLAAQLGMVAVNVPASEIYTAMERGAVDCVDADFSQLTSGATIMDLTKSVMMLQHSPGYNAAHLTFNPDFWKKLTNDQRRLLLNESATAMAKSHIVYDREVASAMQAAKAKGVQLIEPDAGLKATYAKWVADGYGGLPQYARDRLKIAEPEKTMATFQTYLDKWVKLMSSVDRTNQAAVTTVLKTNLFDKINVATYGMK